MDKDALTGRTIYGVQYFDRDNEDMFIEELRPWLAPTTNAERVNPRLLQQLPKVTHDAESIPADAPAESKGEASSTDSDATDLASVPDVPCERRDGDASQVRLPADATRSGRVPRKRQFYRPSYYALFAGGVRKVLNTSLFVGVCLLAYLSTMLGGSANHMAFAVPYHHESLAAKRRRFEAHHAAASEQHPCVVDWVFIAKGNEIVDGLAMLVPLPKARDVPVPRNYDDAVGHPKYGKHWRKARDEEVQNMFDNGVWKKCKLPPGQSTVGTVWVWKAKSTADGAIERFKARLCAQGFSQKFGVNYNSTFSPVVRGSTLRFQIADAVVRGMKLVQLDFKSAFLQSPIDGEVYLRPPRGVPVPKGWVLKLEKGMYGLKQASKLWYTLLNSTLLDLGFRQSVADPCLYIFEDSEFRCTITTWVDDCVVAHNSDERWATIRDLLSQKFPLSAVSSLNWLLGMDVRQRDGWVELNQGKHIDDLLHAFGMFHCATSGVTTPIVHGTELGKSGCPANDDEREKCADAGGCDSYEEFVSRYKQLIGGLLYIAMWTRPDISTAISILARIQICPGMVHWKSARRVLKYLKATRTKCLRFCGYASRFRELVGFVDADYAESDRDTSKSRTGYVYFQSGAPCLWRSSLQPVVAQSSCEAEYVAANAAARDAEWVRLITDDLGTALYQQELYMDKRDERGILLFEDNQGTIALAKNFMVSGRSKHIRVRFHYVRQQIRDAVIRLSYINTKLNVADLFTKILKPATFMFHRDKLVQDPI